MQGTERVPLLSVPVDIWASLPSVAMLKRTLASSECRETREGYGDPLPQARRTQALAGALDLDLNPSTGKVPVCGNGR